MNESQKKFLEDNKILISILTIMVFLLLLGFFYFYIFKSNSDINSSDVNNSNTPINNVSSMSIADYLATHPEARSRPLSELDKNGDGIIDYRDGVSLNNDLNSNLTSSTLFQSSQSSSNSDFNKNFNSNFNSDSSFLNSNNNSNNLVTDNYAFDSTKYEKEGYFNLANESVNSNINPGYGSSSSVDNFNNNYNPDNYSAYTNTTGLGAETNFDNYLNDINNFYSSNTNDPTEVVNNQSLTNLTKLSSTEGIF